MSIDAALAIMRLGDTLRAFFRTYYRTAARMIMTLRDVCAAAHTRTRYRG